MTTPTPELMTAEQAAALLEFYSRFKRVIPQDKAEDDASAALRTIIALHEALAAANARADAAEARVAVRVKPLVWRAREDYGQYYGRDHNDRFHYTVLPETQGELDGPWVCFLDSLWRPYPTLEAAQAAAQADYEARIRAALATGERTPVAWVGREGYFTTDPHQASAHAYHGTPLTPLYASAALETGADDE